MKKLLIHTIRLFSHVLPSQQMRLLMGAWLLSAGVVSCADGKEKKEKKEEKKKDNTEEISCYAPMPPKDSAIEEDKSKNIESDEQVIIEKDTSVMPPHTCYAPIPESIPGE